MCGICGLFEYALSGVEVDREQLRRMNDTIRHRGPDDEGYYINGPVGMAMRRLSIIDLAGGHQPISNETGDVWVVFNGEIYNYREIAAELTKKGHRLRSSSDTEVIVHLYEELGPACVERLDGMFAFAIHDARRSAGEGGRLVIARDRLGKKPLYYADLGQSLIFGSELKPVLLDPRVSRDIDPCALHHYLSLLMIPSPHTIFRAVRKLPPGCLMVCDRKGLVIESYWDLAPATAERKVSEDEAVANVRELLYRAVERRLVSDVPLGAFLSGGLDSSVIVALMSRLMDEPVKTFSIGFAGPRTHDELPYARVVARHFETDHREFTAEPNIVETLPEIVSYADEPFAISSAIPLFYISKAAREHATVVLTGDGGDEAFGGYETYLYERWAGLLRRLPRVTDALVNGGAALLPGGMDSRLGRLRCRIRKFIGNSRHEMGRRRLGWSSAFSEDEKFELYSPALRHAAAGFSTPLFLENRLLGLPPDPVAQANGLDFRVWLPDEMLCKVDRMTMGASIEARSPLLDTALVEYLAGLSFDLKIPGNRVSNLKHLMRRAVSDLIPPEILNRPKHGFNVPLDHWFRTGARTYLEAHLSPERIRRRGLFDPGAVSRLLARHQAGEINGNNRLYALLALEVWAERYLRP